MKGACPLIMFLGPGMKTGEWKLTFAKDRALFLLLSRYFQLSSLAARVCLSRADEMRCWGLIPAVTRAV